MSRLRLYTIVFGFYCTKELADRFKWCSEQHSYVASFSEANQKSGGTYYYPPLLFQENIELLCFVFFLEQVYLTLVVYTMPLVPTDLLYDFAAEAAPVARAYLVDEVPKAALRSAAQGFAFAHHLGQGAVSGLVGAAILGAYRAMGRAGPPNLRGSSNSTTRLPPRARSRARPMEKPSRAQLKIDGPGSASSNSNVRKSSRREDIASGLDIVERPLRLAKFGKTPAVCSVWKSLRDMVSGKKVLKNSFSFKMSSRRDQRGLMAIPLRHDGNFAMTDSDWTIGAQAMTTHADGTGAGGDGFGEYATMLRDPVMADWNKQDAPPLETSNIVVPRLNLPTLEQTSWDLNNLKLFSGANLTNTIAQKYIAGYGNAHATSAVLVPTLQLGGSAVPYGRDTFSNDLPNGYPAPRDSYARKQHIEQDLGLSGADTSVLPQFKTQLGSGSLKMRLCNQGTNQVTVEFVVLKVKDVFGGNIHQGSGGEQHPTLDAGDDVNMTRIWRNLYDTVGDSYRRKTCSNVSYAMGNKDSADMDKVLQWDPLINPHKPWLPDSHFRSTYFSKYNDTIGGVLGDNGPEVGLTNEQIPTAGTDATLFSSASTVPVIPVSANNPLHGTDNHSGWNNDRVNGSAPPGKKTHYRPVARGHCTISAAGERTVTVPIPGSNYSASMNPSGSWSYNYNSQLDGAHILPMTEESYIVCMSLNGSLQDLIEPNQQTGNDSIRVIGKAYTDAKLDCYCQYTETVYPSHCDYDAVPSVAYNLGEVRKSQVVTGTNSKAFSGKVLPMADAVPVVTTGVLQTGASDRGGTNEGGD